MEESPTICFGRSFKPNSRVYMACFSAGRLRFSYQEEYPDGLSPCHAGCQGEWELYPRIQLHKHRREFMPLTVIMGRNQNAYTIDAAGV